MTSLVRTFVRSQQLQMFFWFISVHDQQRHPPLDLDLNRVKRYEISSQLLVFGYCREIHLDAPDVVIWIVLAFYYPPEHIASFRREDFEVDDTKMIVTKRNRGWRTAYGYVPMICDERHRGVLYYEFKCIRGSSAFIGIDRGTRNMHCDFGMTSSYHYGLWGADGKLYEKGILSHQYSTCFRIGTD